MSAPPADVVAGAAARPHYSLEELCEVMLTDESRLKAGRDRIFACWARYQAAVASGQDAINGTVGSLLDNDGDLAVNTVVSRTLREQADFELSAYAPLPGLPHFRLMVRRLALGDGLSIMQHHGIHSEAIITPGGTGALYLSARNLLSPGDALLLRDRHWSPYQTIAAECRLGLATWPLIPSNGSEHAQVDADALRSVLKDLANSQDRILSWLNDPAHNPTGMSLDAAGRALVLSTFAEQARCDPTVGVTLFVDGAYACYAREHHGWGDTIAQFSANDEWPANLLICYGFSASKAYTLYGQRCGALVMLHPSQPFLDKMLEVMLHTGRGTWSGANRLPQATVHTVHTNAGKYAEWKDEKDRFHALLERRREVFNARCEIHGVPLLPNHDGYFAFLPLEESSPVAQAAEEKGLYVVPLEGGIRIGICSIPEQQVERAADILAEAWQQCA